ncbi:MAG: acyl-ACP--UDP-N-acetylglucosamine O-acyltransferase [Rhodospirillaceae bacterium]|nr:acyl-ACP--UDP-N-acetylglucosamine O-acyltransferase [Rhodospirillaceae bacterium]
MPDSIHPTAIVEDGAVIPASARIGPYCMVGANVTLGEGVVLANHVSLRGDITLGDRVHVYPNAVLGEPPQIYGGDPNPGRLEVGADTVIREHVTLNLGSSRQDRLTRIGTACMLMAGSHVGHDCVVGNHVIMANNATLGGHVTLGNHVFVGGLSALHQRVRVGDHAFIGGMTGVEQDVIPFGMVTGDRGRLDGLNVVGLKRRGYTHPAIHRLRAVYRALFLDPQPWAERLAAVRSAHGSESDVAAILSFIDAGSQRGIMKARRGSQHDDPD